jgi:hypothetical protein
VATRVLTKLIDDLDGGEAAVTTTIMLDGREFEIDLSTAHHTELRKQLDPFLRAARKAGSTERVNGQRKPRERIRVGGKLIDADSDGAEVRAWAVEMRKRDPEFPEVQLRGKVPERIRQLYREHGGKLPAPPPPLPPAPVAPVVKKRAGTARGGRAGGSKAGVTVVR